MFDISVMESYIENDSGNVHGYIQENNIHFNVLNKIKIFGACIQTKLYYGVRTTWLRATARRRALACVFDRGSFCLTAHLLLPWGLN